MLLGSSSCRGIHHCYVSVSECWNRNTARGETQRANVLYIILLWKRMAGLKAVALLLCLLPGFVSDSFVKHSSLRLVGCGSLAPYHTASSHTWQVCVCVCAPLLHVCMFSSSLCSFLSSAWLVQLWFFYYTLPTDSGTCFQPCTPTSH